MILSFHDRYTEAVSAGRCPKGFPRRSVQAARSKLILLDAAASLDDLKRPPGNKLHALSQDRAGQHTIAVNKQFRICFIWTEGGPTGVEVTDYH